MLAHFQQLDSLLRHYRPFWQFQPFHHRQSRWQDLAPDLHQVLQALDDDALDRLQKNPQAGADFLHRWISDSQLLLDLCRLPSLATASKPLPARLNYAIEGRKWQQITGFADCVPAGFALVDWCAGKGHLGRLLAAGAERKVTALEWQPALCDQGVRLAARAGVAMDFVCVDVMNHDCSDWLAGHSHAVALHACGDLHQRLIQQLVVADGQGLTLAPCCFNRIVGREYTPLSAAAMASDLQLDKNDLKLPLRQRVTASARECIYSRREVIWRLGFDSLQRELRNKDDYLPLPAVPKALLKTDFAAFVAWALRCKQLPGGQLPDLLYFHQQGEQRYRAVQEMEFVQQLFQRPLELWLLLDKALFLQEQGYQVEVGEFCEYRLSPRNWLIRAQRKAAGDAEAVPAG